jgi:hypothetical protein
MKIKLRKIFILVEPMIFCERSQTFASVRKRSQAFANVRERSQTFASVRKRS